MNQGFPRFAQRATAALVLIASSVLGAAIGCSSASEDCCIGYFPDSTTSQCLCGSLDADGVICTVSTTGSTCTITCTQDAQTTTGTGAPASSCAGQPTACFNSMGVGTETFCTDSYAACTDGHSYELDCTGTSCTCKKDGAVTKTGTGACGDETELCGWNLE